MDSMKMTFAVAPMHAESARIANAGIAGIGAAPNKKRVPNKMHRAEAALVITTALEARGDLAIEVVEAIAYQAASIPIPAPTIAKMKRPSAQEVGREGLVNNAAPQPRSRQVWMRAMAASNLARTRGLGIERSKRSRASIEASTGYEHSGQTACTERSAIE